MLSTATDPTNNAVPKARAWSGRIYATEGCNLCVVAMVKTTTTHVGLDRGGPRSHTLETADSLKQKHFIDLSKGATPLVVLGCMFVYQSWDNPTACLLYTSDAADE